MTETEEPHFSDILFGLLSPSNHIRTKSEHYYRLSLSEHPDYTIIKLMDSLNNSPSPQVSCLCAILLKQVVSPRAKIQYFTLLPDADQNAIKANLLHKSLSEQDDTFRRLLCDTVSQLGITLSNTDINSWPELSPGLYFLPKSNLNLSTIEILGNIIPYTADHANQHLDFLAEAISSCLSSDLIVYRVKSIELLHSLLSVLEEYSEKAFVWVTPKLLSTVEFSFNSSESLTILGSLVDIADDCPSIFTPYIKDCLSLSEAICQQADVSAKFLSLELCVSVIENSPYLSERQEIVEPILTRIFVSILSIEFDTDDQMISYEDNIEFPNDVDISEGVDLICRMLEVPNNGLVKAEVTRLIRDTINNSDWRMGLAAVLVLSENFGQLESSSVHSLFASAINYASSSNAILRTAVHILIGNLRDKDLISYQHFTIFKILINGLEESDPLLLYNCIKSIDSIVKVTSPSILQQYSGTLLRKIEDVVQECKFLRILEESCKTIASLFIVLKSAFRDYYDQVVLRLLDILHRFQGDIFKSLREIIIQSVIIISSVIGKGSFRPYAKKVLFYLFNLQISEINSGEISSSLYKCWEGLADILTEELEAFLESVVPILLKILVNDNNNMQALKTLKFVIGKQPEMYWKFVDDSVRVLLPLVSYTLKEHIRGESATALAFIVVSCKFTSVERSVELAKVFIEVIIKNIEEEYIQQIRIQQLQSLSVILEAPSVPFLSFAELSGLIQKLRNLSTAISCQDDQCESAIAHVLACIYKTHDTSVGVSNS